MGVITMEEKGGPTGLGLAELGGKLLRAVVFTGIFSGQ